MLQALKTSYTDLQLLVPSILSKLLREHVMLEDTSAVLSDAHLQCWGYDDGLVHDGKEGSGVCVCVCVCVCMSVCLSVCLCGMNTIALIQ